MEKHFEETYIFESIEVYLISFKYFRKAIDTTGMYFNNHHHNQKMKNKTIITLKLYSSIVQWICNFQSSWERYDNYHVIWNKCLMCGLNTTSDLPKLTIRVSKPVQEIYPCKRQSLEILNFLSLPTLGRVVKT